MDNMTPCYLSYFHHVIGKPKTMTSIASPNPFSFTPPNHGVIGHRGHPFAAPENTLASFESAAMAGANWVEFDIQLTRDNQWVVIHDDTLDRTTNGHGLVTDFTLAELQKLDIINTPKKIPTLIEVLDLCQSHGLVSNIEIKLPDQCPEELFKRSSHAFVEFIQTRYPTPNTYPFLVSSFNHRMLESVSQTLPNIPLGFLCEDPTETLLYLQKPHTNPASINISAKYITPEIIKKAVQLNLPVLVYTINNPQTASELLDAGAYGVFTDQCDTLLQNMRFQPKL